MRVGRFAAALVPLATAGIAGCLWSPDIHEASGGATAGPVIDRAAVTPSLDDQPFLMTATSTFSVDGAVSDPLEGATQLQYAWYLDFDQEDTAKSRPLRQGTGYAQLTINPCTSRYQAVYGLTINSSHRLELFVTRTPIPIDENGLRTLVGDYAYAAWNLTVGCDCLAAPGSPTGCTP